MKKDKEKSKREAVIPEGDLKGPGRVTSIEDAQQVSFPSSITQIKDLIEQMENQKIQELAEKLLPIRDKVHSSLKTVSKLADDLDRERIKLEDVELRFKSVVENSRRTVISSLKREAASELPIIRSVNDAKKFKERLEAMMERFGEVAGSHSKVLNIFMKKYAGRMKSEFETLTSLLKETKSIMSEFDEDRAPLIKCSSLLNTLTQKADSIKSSEQTVASAISLLQRLELDLALFRSNFESLVSSAEYKEAQSKLSELYQVQQSAEGLRIEIAELFSHISRALSKYSYGVTKDTEEMLSVISAEPWRIFEEPDTTSYSRLLYQIKNSIQSGEVQLKDSDRMVTYIDNILSNWPELQSRSKMTKSRLEALSNDSERVLVQSARDLSEKIAHCEEEIVRNKRSLELYKRQLDDKVKDYSQTQRELEKAVGQLTGKSHNINQAD